MVDNASNIGQKAKNLKILVNIFPQLVPEFLVVEFKEFFIDWNRVSKALTDLSNSYLNKRLSLTEYEEKLTRLIKDAEINKGLIHQLEDKLIKQGFQKVSYRTSASQEDLEDSSFAGQYVTFLDQDIRAQTIKKCVMECAKSLSSPRVLGYLKNNGHLNFNQYGSIIIQKMFYGEVTGVLFTENGHNEIEISYSNSWRNVIVEGNLANSFSIKKSEIEIEDTLPKDLPKTIIEVINAATILEKQEKRPLDIEWSISKDRAALLQFRPVTTHKTEYIIEWDNTNIAESYPGITLPLTYSFIKRLYSKVYPEFLKLLGKPKSSLVEHNHIFENMLGYINGRVCYNINNWYELVKLLPGYKYNKEFFESMLMPAKKKKHIEKIKIKQSLKQRLQLLTTTIRFVWLLLRTNSLSNKFTRRYLKSYEIYKSVLWEHLAADEILKIYDKIERDLLQQWAVPILNDFRTMVFHGLLRKLFFPKENDDSYIQLLSGIYDHTSVEPIRQLSFLAKEVKVILQDYKGNDNEFIEAIKNDKSFDDIHSRINNYLIRFGGRSPDELKLENPRLGESFENFASFLISTAKGYHDTTNLVKTPLSSEKLLKQVNFGRSFFKRIAMRFIFKYVLYQTKSGISKRERFRFYRAQVFGLARNAFLALGNRFVEADLINEQTDIFYLTKSEINDLVLGHAFEHSLKDKISKRKKLFKTYGSKNLGRRLISYGIVAPTQIVTDKDVGNKNKLLGLGVSNGTFKGEVVVVKEFNPQADVKGKILVTEHTDPGWTLLFLNASALVVERGNALSHASIVAREIGIPAVVAVEGATDILKNGQKIVVNGGTGEIIIP